MDLAEKTQNENRHPWELSRAHCISRALAMLSRQVFSFYTNNDFINNENIYASLFK